MCLYLNLLLQIWHANGSSSLLLRSCRDMIEYLVNLLSHLKHLSRSLLAWVSSWECRYDLKICFFLLFYSFNNVLQYVFFNVNFVLFGIFYRILHRHTKMTPCRISVSAHKSIAWVSLSENININIIMSLIPRW